MATEGVVLFFFFYNQRRATEDRQYQLFFTQSVLPFLVVCDQFGRFSLSRSASGRQLFFGLLRPFSAISHFSKLITLKNFVLTIFQSIISKVTKIISSLFALHQSTLLILMQRKVVIHTAENLLIFAPFFNYLEFSEIFKTELFN